jgi:hypothetical protein
VEAGPQDLVGRQAVGQEDAVVEALQNGSHMYQSMSPDGKSVREDIDDDIQDIFTKFLGSSR